MKKIILSFLLGIVAISVSARELTVLSVSGRPVVIVGDNQRQPIKPNTKLSDNAVISIPYNSSIDLIDTQAGKQYHIKTPGRNTLSVFLANGKNGVSSVTKRYLKYVTEQVSGGAVRAQRAHSDAATITREVAKYEPEKEGDGELDEKTLETLRLLFEGGNAENLEDMDEEKLREILKLLSNGEDDDDDDDEWDVEKWKENFKKYSDENRREYEEFRQQIIKEYEEFRAEINQEYAEFLADPWAEFEREEAEPIPPKEPDVKPLVIPKNGKDRLPPIKSVPIKVEDDNIKVLDLPTPQPLPVLPIIQDKQAPVIDTLVVPVPEPVPEPALVPDTLGLKNPVIEEHSLDVNVPVNNTPKVEIELLPIVLPAPVGTEVLFFGTKVYVRYAPEEPFRLASLNEKDIAEAWLTLSEDDFNNTIADCLTIRHQLHLSDWAYLELLQCVANTLLGKDTNEATMLMAYIYCQSGYKMRLGKTSSRLYMLFASRHNIYNRDYYILNGENFYPLNCNEETMSICTLPYPEEKALSLVLTEEPILADDATPVRTLVNDISPKMEATVSVNKNLIEFYGTYPSSEIGGDLMTRWAMYANTPMAKNIVENLYPKLLEQLGGLTQRDAVSKLLAFVQHSLEYKYDDEVWGHDRAFFAEETLYYPYADCEDRSILFSRLVRDLVGAPVALVFYPGHLATAVAFSEQVNGDYIPIKDKNFVVCDPTYIGAPIGRSMPGLNQNGIRVIVLK